VLTTLAKEQDEYSKWRADEYAEHFVAKTDLVLGLSGVRVALEILCTYYDGAAFVQQPEPPLPATHDATTGTGQNIVGVLEVVESDFEARRTRSGRGLAKAAQEDGDNKIAGAVHLRGPHSGLQGERGAERCGREVQDAGAHRS
jgi:hypothetical protein